jgi:hypothetical protein
MEVCAGTCCTSATIIRRRESAGAECLDHRDPIQPFHTNDARWANYLNDLSVNEKSPVGNTGEGACKAGGREWLGGMSADI